VDTTEQNAKLKGLSAKRSSLTGRPEAGKAEWRQWLEEAQQARIDGHIERDDHGIYYVPGIIPAVARMLIAILDWMKFAFPAIGLLVEVAQAEGRFGVLAESDGRYSMAQALCTNQIIQILWRELSLPSAANWRNWQRWLGWEGRGRPWPLPTTGWAYFFARGGSDHVA
jgi:hypothetical protein